jgi:hypothetical protein
MAKRNNKKSYGGSTGRAKPMANKMSVTKSGKRRYGCGGKMKK